MNSVSDELNDWKKIAAVLHGELPKIDQRLTKEDVPVWARKLKAFDFVSREMLRVSDWDAFYISEAHGRLLIIIADWYRNRYGDAVDDNRNLFFVSTLPIHGTPFALGVPLRFTLRGDKRNTSWLGFPASVQAEEDPLHWIERKEVVEALSCDELDVVRKAALETSNLVRSIGFDLRSLEEDKDSHIAELAGSVRSDIQSSARNLCSQTEAGLRSAAWDASQATEKALKLLVRRKGQTPPNTHKLSKLADQAESVGSDAIDRVMLALVPSGSDATGIRYGGDISLSKAGDAYAAALAIIKQVVFDAKPDVELNIREARILLQRPPWFDFDTNGFSKQLCE